MVMGSRRVLRSMLLRSVQAQLLVRPAASALRFNQNQSRSLHVLRPVVHLRPHEAARNLGASVSPMRFPSVL